MKLLPEIVVEPLAGHCIVKRLPKRSLRRRGSIILPDDFTGCPWLGVVVRCGAASDMSRAEVDTALSLLEEGTAEALGDLGALLSANARAAPVVPGSVVMYHEVMGTEINLGSGGTQGLVRLCYEDLLAVMEDVDWTEHATDE